MHALHNTPNAQAELTTLTLPISADGETWSEVSFTGESARYVDAQAVAYITAYRDLIDVAFNEETPWSKFPNTFKTLSRNAQPNPAPQATRQLICDF